MSDRRPSRSTSLRKTDKHLLESSLLYPLMVGSAPFKERVSSALEGGRRYTTAFVRMEFRRRVLVGIADFCIQLYLPGRRSADDLLAAWSNHFGSRDVKLLVVLCRQLIPTGIDTGSPASKEAVFRCLAEYAFQLDYAISYEAIRLEDQGHRCHRAVPNLLSAATHPEDILQALTEFVVAHRNVAECRSRCKIDVFLTRHRSRVEHWTEDAENVRGEARRPQRKLVPLAQAALTKGLDTWSCRECEKLGDWIITLDCLDFLQMEHVDHVYDYLCPDCNLLHRLHAPDR